MTRAESYTEMDKIIAKESNKKEDADEGKEKNSIDVKEMLKGGENFVCSIGCKHCPSM
jgi:hypothetical protein